ncbi:hypothetical protein D3C72_1892050 [compost metagenome]
MNRPTPKITLLRMKVAGLMVMPAWKIRSARLTRFLALSSSVCDLSACCTVLRRFSRTRLASAVCRLARISPWNAFMRASARLLPSAEGTRAKPAAPMVTAKRTRSRSVVVMVSVP